MSTTNTIELVKFTGVVKRFAHLEINNDCEAVVTFWVDTEKDYFSVEMLGDAGVEFRQQLIDFFYTEEDMHIRHSKGALVEVEGCLVEREVAAILEGTYPVTLIVAEKVRLLGINHNN